MSDSRVSVIIFSTTGIGVVSLIFDCFLVGLCSRSDCIDVRGFRGKDIALSLRELTVGFETQACPDFHRRCIAFPELASLIVFAFSKLFDFIFDFLLRRFLCFR